MQQHYRLSPGTPISRLAVFDAPIGRLEFPGSTAAAFFINTLLKIGSSYSWYLFFESGRKADERRGVVESEAAHRTDQ